ncbi:MAG: (2Fe-2S)-binding protein [Burkholderiales bacterium RIFOXYC12_FULL_60_6]|nr:MAG: (2Fe-2S)-binding protein [Burkholderiales bacterium RIFOXYC12_FULL_60_6]
MSKITKTAKVVFIEHNGAEHVVDADIGGSLMQAAINNLVPGIEADCGGLCACATCHGYVDPAWMDKIPPKNRGETDLLVSAVNMHPESRLTCQIKVQEELDGIIVRLPASQY